MSHHAIAGSSSSVVGQSPAKTYRPPSSVYEIYSPLTTNVHSELDAVQNRIRMSPPPNDIPEDRVASPCSEQLAGEYRAALFPPLARIQPDPIIGRSKEGRPVSSAEPERLYGLVPAVFWLVVLLIVSLIAAGVAIGLGVGLTRVRGSGDLTCPFGTSPTTFVTENINPSPQTEVALSDAASLALTSTADIETTPSTTSSAAWQSYTNPGTVDSVIINAQMPDMSCPDSNNVTTNFPFYVNGSSLTYQIRCETNYNIAAFPSVKDIQVIPNVQSLVACIELCSFYTVQLPQGGSRDYNTGYSAFCTGIYYWQNDCYLKSGVASGITGGGASGDGAILIRNDSWSE